MRRQLTLATLVFAGWLSTASAQLDRYGDASAPVTPSTVEELPFSNQGFSGSFDAASTRSEPPRTLVDQPPPVRPMQPVVPTPQSPATMEPRNRSYGSTAGTSSLSPPVSNADYAESLMRDALKAPRGTQLSGAGIALADVVRAAGTRSEQSESIAAYWDLCSAVADYYLSLYEQAELERLAARSGGSTTPVREALTRMTARRDTALTAARASQLQLASLLGRRPGDPLPLPGDMPLCAKYITRYSQSFPGDGPQEAVELNRLLPLRHAELLGAAAAVGEAEDWFKEVTRRANSDQGAGVVKALELLALNRRAFVQIARDYNKRIARYTELARPGQLRTERLVAMLIKTDSIASRAPQTVAPNARTRSQATPPPTFRDSFGQQVDTAVLPAGAVEDANVVEKVAPGEISVLQRRNSE